jgi:3-methyladenine DNA glycosylase AlkD
MLNSLKKELQEIANEKHSEILQRFFKTGKGEYGEGDIFIGIKVPVQRAIAKKYFGLPLIKIQDLLNSEIHEYRLVGLIILVDKFKKASEEERANIFNFYLKNARKINNWDLVDLSCHHIVGNFLKDKDKNILYKLSHSENLWERRIAVVSNYAFIKENKFEDILAISELLLEDKHDLINKAVGWMLREVGKKDIKILKNFLREHYENIPRTTLRYAIEKFEERDRKKWLRGEI